MLKQVADMKLLVYVSLAFGLSARVSSGLSGLLGGFPPLKQVVVTLDTTCTDVVLGWAVTCVIMKLPTTLCTFLFRETFLLQLLFVVRHGFQLLLTGVEGLIGPLGSLSGRGHGHALV